jgi:deazaflavin-dependent oxidoreductase (nitroreductase family)
MRVPLLYWIGRLNRRFGWRGSRLHVRAYRMLRGRLVGSMQGRPIVLLTTTGRVSGRPRTSPITVLRDRDGYLAVASYAPQWRRNLEANPHALVYDRGREVAVVASTCDDPMARERFRAFYPALTSIESLAAEEGRVVPLLRLAVAGPRRP